MARRARKSGGKPLLPVVAVIALAVGGAIAWRLRVHQGAVGPAPPRDAPVPAVAERIEPRNEGREVKLSGALRVLRPARDGALAIHADAVVLVRDVQMLQWQEHCAGSSCTYALEWSPQRVDSRAFREPAGHRNATPFPFSSERFAAEDVRLGAYAVDADLAAAGAALQPYPVSAARLPPNLAATFRDCDGALCTGDPAHAAAGDLRVAYRVVPAGSRTLTGVQREGRLRAPKR